MPARVLVVGLDASDKDLLERWTAEGDLPAFAALRERSAEYRLANGALTLPPSFWPEIWSGRSSGRTGFYFPMRQLRTGETSVRPVEPEEVDGTAFWSIAGAAGRRVAAVDVPWTVPIAGVNGLHVEGWGSHDRPFGFRCEPPELREELRARYGDYPLWPAGEDGAAPRPPCYALGASDAEYDYLLGALLAGLERKRSLFLDLLAREPWDVFACAFGEPQCVGHQFWHFLDAPAAPERFQNAIRSVYRKIDEGLGALVEAAGEDATVLAISSAAMGPTIGGQQLIPEVLVRLGLSSGAGAAAQIRSRLPVGLRVLLRRVVPAAARAPLQAKAGSLTSPLDSQGTRAVALDGDTASWIRLNLSGREPHGSVEPDEAPKLLEELRRELLALEDPATGEPIVAQATTAFEAFGPDHHPDVPDLMVSFRQDLGRLDACRSERVGLIRQPHVPPGRRTSAHPPAPTWLWAAGSPFEARSQHEGNILDIAPTVLSLLGVEAPDRLDGHPLES